MIYSENTLKHRKAFRNVLISWAIIALIGGLIGFAVASYTHTAVPSENVVVYGSHDGKIVKASAAVRLERANNFVKLDVPLDEEIQKFIFVMTDAYKVDYALVMALIEQESSFDPVKISPSNDYGLMQINRVNHAILRSELGQINFLDPYGNVKAGIYLLRGLFEKYHSASKVLMAYNLGESGASRLWMKGVTETPYTKAVFDKQAKFTEQMVKQYKGVKNNELAL